MVDSMDATLLKGSDQGPIDAKKAEHVHGTMAKSESREISTSFCGSPSSNGEKLGCTVTGSSSQRPESVSREISAAVSKYSKPGNDVEDKINWSFVLL